MPGSLRRVDSVKRRGLVKKDPQKNMTDFLLRFEINKVRRSNYEFAHLNRAHQNHTHNIWRFFYVLTLMVLINVLSKDVFWVGLIRVTFIRLVPFSSLTVCPDVCAAVSHVQRERDPRPPSRHRGPRHGAETVLLRHDLVHVPARDLPQVSRVHGSVLACYIQCCLYAIDVKYLYSVYMFIYMHCYYYLLFSYFALWSNFDPKPTLIKVNIRCMSLTVDTYSWQFLSTDFASLVN